MTNTSLTPLERGLVEAGWTFIGLGLGVWWAFVGITFPIWGLFKLFNTTAKDEVKYRKALKEYERS